MSALLLRPPSLWRACQEGCATRPNWSVSVARGRPSQDRAIDLPELVRGGGHGPDALAVTRPGAVPALATLPPLLEMRHPLSRFDADPSRRCAGRRAGAVRSEETPDWSVIAHVPPRADTRSTLSNRARR